MTAQLDTPMVSAREIRESPLGLDLSDTQCRKLAEIAGAVGLDVGGVLIEEGQCDQTLYVVSSGSLEVSKATGGGERVTLQLLRHGDVAGIMGFVDGICHTADIRAVTRSELIALDRKDLEQQLSTDPELVYQVMRAIVRSAHRILGQMNNQFVEMNNYITHQHGRY